MDTSTSKIGTADVVVPSTDAESNDALIGGIVGGIVALLLVVGLIAFLVARSRRNVNHQVKSGPIANTAPVATNSRVSIDNNDNDRINRGPRMYDDVGAVRMHAQYSHAQ